MTRRRILPPRNAVNWRRRGRASRFSMTSSSAGVSEAALDEGAVPARSSMSFSMSISIFIARRSRRSTCHELCADRLALGHLSQVSIGTAGHRLVQRGGQQCRQVFRRTRTAQITGLTLLEPACAAAAWADLVFTRDLIVEITAIIDCQMLVPESFPAKSPGRETVFLAGPRRESGRKLLIAMAFVTPEGAVSDPKMSLVFPRPAGKNG
jgi:hypothetical protein